MLYLGYIFALTSALNIGNGKSIKYLSNFKFEDIVYGEEEVIKDFVTLANDPKQICLTAIQSALLSLFSL